MDALAVVDVQEVQERRGHTRSAAGLDELTFLHYCEDIQDQPTWRKQADKADDYYDGNQIDPETMQELRDKGMGELISNLIKPTIDVVLGMEAKTRTDWRVVADSDTLQDVAEALSEKLHESERESRADRACSDAYAAQIKAGIGWVEVSRNSDPFKYPHRVSNPHRREIDWDWRDREPDLQGSRYLLRRRWYDLDEAAVYFPRHKELLHAAGTGWGAWWLQRMTESAELMQAFEQERGWTLEEWEYRDTVRKRICLYEMWYRQLRRGYVLKLPDRLVVEMNLDNPLHAIAVARGMVKPTPAIYSKWGMAIFAGPHKLMDTGAIRKRHPYIPFWGYRESLTGTPYGLVRSMISPQDEVNARRRKLMWLLSAVRVLMDSDALDERYNSFKDVLDEIARADAAVILNPNRINKQGAIQIDQNLQLSEAQYKIMVASEEMIQKVAGVFNALLGRDSSANSGIAIDSLVEQGSTVLAEINDNYRYARRLVGEQLLELVKEDIGRDEVEVLVGEPGHRKTVVLNERVPDPEVGNVVLLRNAVQQAGVRVTLDDVPSSPSYRKQQFTMLAELVKGLAPEAQAVLTPYLLELSDQPNRKKMADELRAVLNLPVDGQTNPQVALLTQQVQQLTGMLEQAQAELKSKKDFEDRQIALKEREIELKAKDNDQRVRKAEQDAELLRAKVEEANARAEAIRAETARNDATFAIQTAVQQLGEQVQQVMGGVSEARTKAEATKGEVAERVETEIERHKTEAAEQNKKLMAALESLAAAVKKVEATAGSQIEALRNEISAQIADVIVAEGKRAKAIEKRATEAVQDTVRRQEELAEQVRESVAAGAGPSFRGATFTRDADGNITGGVADYGDEKRRFKVVRGEGGIVASIEFEA